MLLVSRFSFLVSVRVIFYVEERNNPEYSGVSRTLLKEFLISCFKVQNR